MSYVNSQIVTNDVSTVLVLFHDADYETLDIERERCKTFVKTLLGHSPSELEVMSEQDRKESIDSHRKALNEFLNDGKGKTDVVFCILMEIVYRKLKANTIEELSCLICERYESFRDRMISMHNTWNNIESKVRSKMEQDFHQYVVDGLLHAENIR